MLDAVNKFAAGMSITGTLGVIGVVCFILAAFVALRTRSIKGTSLVAAVGALALTMTRLSDITLLDDLGIRTELQHTIDDATAKIAQLRKLAVAISEPQLSELAMNGAMLSELRFSYQYGRKKQIVDTLKSLGVSEDDIATALRVWMPATLRKLSNVIAVAIAKTDNALAEKFRAMRIDAHENPANPDKLREFLRDNHITDKDVIELVDDYEHLFKTGEVRRPEVFPAGINP
jgi:hypothetical protein